MSDKAHSVHIFSTELKIYIPCTKNNISIQKPYLNDNLNSFSFLEKQLQKLALRISSGFQTLENSASWFQMFSCVCKSDETLPLVLVIVLSTRQRFERLAIYTEKSRGRLSRF